MLELGKARVVWMTGLSGAGKTTLCQSVAKRLHTECCKAIILDGDIIREGLCSDLGFSTEDRIESVRRIAHVAKLFASNGTTVLVAVMAPIEAARRVARSIVPNMIQVFVDASLESCELRDVKGLYAKARSGELQGFTGIDSPFEPPLDAQVVCHSDRESIEVCTDRILNVLQWPAQDARWSREPTELKERTLALLLRDRRGYSPGNATVTTPLAFTRLRNRVSVAWEIWLAVVPPGSAPRSNASRAASPLPT